MASPYQQYNPIPWANEPSESTPIDEDNLNHIQQGIVNLEAHTLFYEEIGTIDETTGEITLYETEATNNEEE